MFHFTLILLKLEHALITVDLLNQNPTKKVMLHKKWFQLSVANRYISRMLNTIIAVKVSYDKNHLAQETIFHFLIP